MVTQVSAITVFCEDVRMELSGQATLVGVYPGFIIINEADQSPQVAQWIQLKGLPLGEYKVKVAALYRTTEDRDLGHIETDVQIINENAPVIITPVGLVLRATTNGELVIQISVNDDMKVDGGKIPVQVLPRNATDIE